MSADAPIRVNRVPDLTRWATIVAERQGYPPDTVLTLGRFVAGSSARAKARSLDIAGDAQEATGRSPRMGRPFGMIQRPGSETWAHCWRGVGTKGLPKSGTCSPKYATVAIPGHTVTWPLPRSLAQLQAVTQWRRAGLHRTRGAGRGARAGSDGRSCDLATDRSCTFRRRGRKMCAANELPPWRAAPHNPRRAFFCTAYCGLTCFAVVRTGSHQRRTGRKTPCPINTDRPPRRGLLTVAAARYGWTQLASR
jgi:hypothetical protein